MVTEHPKHRESFMPHIEIFADAYPEQVLALARAEITRREQKQAARASAAERRRRRRAALRGRLALWLKR
jgi:hypothetical protein